MVKYEPPIGGRREQGDRVGLAKARGPRARSPARGLRSTLEADDLPGSSGARGRRLDRAARKRVGARDEGDTPGRCRGVDVEKWRSRRVAGVVVSAASSEHRRNEAAGAGGWLGRRREGVRTDVLSHSNIRMPQMGSDCSLCGRGTHSAAASAFAAGSSAVSGWVTSPLMRSISPSTSSASDFANWDCEEVVLYMRSSSARSS